ncbi:MAG: hypothetical protein GY768_08010 [Planctomycetaceae bacterium]|nr:hypothetical protein [Planctomycetaceae bacterium]
MTRSSDGSTAKPRPSLDREEYVEQAYFFQTLLDRLGDNLPLQEVMDSIRHEILATTKLPLAIDFLLSELKHAGGFGLAMARLDHYFTPYQTFVIQQAEDERGRFDFRVALAILQKEAQYRIDEPTREGVFLYQFETLSRNRLVYDAGLGASAKDPIFDENWSDWIYTVRRQIGLVELADLIFVRSVHYLKQAKRRGKQPQVEPLFGEKEGKIALANRSKNPLLLFAALQRHLGYPMVPRPQPVDESQDRLPVMARKIERLEARLKLLEDEQQGGIDLAKFYRGPQAGQP